MEQIKIISKYLNRYFGVIKFLNVAVFSFAIIASIFILFFDNENNLLLNTSFTLSWLTFEFSESMFSNYTTAKIYFVMLLIGACITIFILLKLISVIRNILNDMIDGNVFKKSMTNHIMELSIISFAYGMFSNIFHFIDYRFLVDYSNLITLLENGKILNTQLSYTFDFSFIVLSAIIYLLSYVFKYGVELQQLSDETL